MDKIIRRLVIGAAAVALVASACGSGNDATSEPEQTFEERCEEYRAATNAAAAEGVTISEETFRAAANAAAQMEGCIHRTKGTPITQTDIVEYLEALNELCLWSENC